MKTLTSAILDQAVALINQLRSGKLKDEELSEVVVKLDSLLLDPHWFNYTIDHVPELSAEEVVRRAFDYKPIQL